MNTTESEIPNIQIDHNTIEKLIKEFKKDLLDDNEEDDGIYDETEMEDDIDEPINSMTVKLKEMEDKYNI